MGKNILINMKTTLIAITAALAVVAGVMYFTAPVKTTLGVPTPVYDSWVHWKQANGKAYGTNSEEEYRLQVYAANFAEVMRLSNTQSSATFELNKFSDLPSDEFASIYTGYNKQSTLQQNRIVQLDESNLKSEVNWVTAGAVAAVKDQGHCGSCWAFSAVAAIESANFIQKKQSSVQTLSEQQLVDCAGGSYHNNGCHGGLMDYAFRYVETHSLQSEDSYPYRAADGSCKSGTGSGTVTGYSDVRSGSASQLRAALNSQPVSVAIQADQSVFQFYKGGVMSDPACGTQLDHAVLAAGYGNEGGEDYFLVRNSWGASWGLSGYIKIGANNTCGILQSPSYPTA